MSKTLREAARWAVFSALCLLGFFAFMMLAGDDDPENPLPAGQWLLIKGAAFLTLLLCVWAGKALHRNGCLPEEIEKEIGEDD